MKLLVATYNIHKGVSSIGNLPRIHALKHGISMLDADILFLQEVQGRHDVHAAKHPHWPREAQHEFLAGQSHHYAYGMNAVYDQGHHGNALLSRYIIKSSKNQDVSDHRFEQRGILHCVVATPVADIHCYVVHFGLFAGGRRRQTEALIQAVNNSSSANDPVIIAGDFNDWGNHLSEILRDRLNVTEVFDLHESNSPWNGVMKKLVGSNIKRMPARTFPAALPCLCLDRIYVRGFTIESAKVMQGAIWSKLSDHVPIVSTLEIS